MSTRCTPCAGWRMATECWTTTDGWTIFAVCGDVLGGRGRGRDRNRESKAGGRLHVAVIMGRRRAAIWDWWEYLQGVRVCVRPPALACHLILLRVLRSSLASSSWSCPSFDPQLSVSELSFVLYHQENPYISSWTTTRSSRPASTPNVPGYVPAVVSPPERQRICERRQASHTYMYAIPAHVHLPNHACWSLVAMRLFGQATARIYALLPRWPYRQTPANPPPR
ncbi:hypothetical protein C8Q80DRAFT_560566 [Daedaleopsis nitida]|nr:hypothetical protein C8Q80DRAFT_560566 [Daedaleopsis nitida]